LPAVLYAGETWSSTLQAIAESEASPSIVKGKGKVHPRTGCEGPEGE
jgi:hypothetical protein